MPASPKSSRTPPPNKFEDYSLTKFRGPGSGLLSLDDKKFKQWPGSAGVGDGNNSAGTLNNSPRIIPIGFDFKFNGITYKTICATEAGEAILIDPENVIDPIYYNLFLVYDAPVTSRMKSTFSGNRKDVLFLLWRDQLNTSYDSIERLSAGSLVRPSIPQSTVDRLRKGIDRPTNETQWNDGYYAVSYCNDDSPNEGKRLVIRWNVTSGVGFSNFIVMQHKFQLVLYENGKIEYRYSDSSINQGQLPYRPPYSGTAPSGTVGAAIGIFANWNGWNFRDFSFDLGYRDEERSKYVNGGYIYDSSYTDTGVNLNGDTGTVPYTCNLDPTRHWPGSIDSGAVYTLLPPKKRRTQRITTISLRDSSSFIDKDTSHFNDQNTINFGVQDVEYPVMLPVDLRTSINANNSVFINELYSSGSIRVARSIRPGMFDDVLRDCIADGRKRSGS